MTVAVDTNVLVRFFVADDDRQADAALALMKASEVVFVPLTVICELVWALRSAYNYDREAIVRVLDALSSKANVRVDRSAFEAGMAVLRAGGDFADGAIAHEGRSMGG